MTTYEAHARPDITLILGGVRSGKSAKAVALASAAAPNPPTTVLFVATGEPSDDEMSDRIAKHRRERPPHWDTLEVPRAFAQTIEAQLQRPARRYDILVVDCVTIWVSNLLLAADENDDIEQVVSNEVRALLDVVTNSAYAPARCLFVTNEVGLGVVPPTPLGRRYRDALGRANQLLAAAANQVTLMIAGLEMPLKNSPTRPVE